MSWSRCDVTQRTLSDPATRDERADGDRDVSIAIAWNQARIRCSGGRSRREARRDGRRQRVENGSMRRACRAADARKPRRPQSWLTGPSDGAPGSPESPQGAEFNRQGLAIGAIRFRGGLGSRQPSLRSRGPQQHDSPRHFVPHLQWCGAVLDAREPRILTRLQTSRRRAQRDEQHGRQEQAACFVDRRGTAGGSQTGRPSGMLGRERSQHHQQIML